MCKELVEMFLTEDEIKDPVPHLFFFCLNFQAQRGLQLSVLLLCQTKEKNILFALMPIFKKWAVNSTVFCNGSVAKFRLLYQMRSKMVHPGNGVQFLKKDYRIPATLCSVPTCCLL